MVLEMNTYSFWLASGLRLAFPAKIGFFAKSIADFLHGENTYTFRTFKNNAFTKGAAALPFKLRENRHFTGKLVRAH